MRSLYKVATAFLINSYMVASSYLFFENTSPNSATQNFPSSTAALQSEPTQTSSFWDVSDIDISFVSRKRKLIALTFDDAPTSTLDPILKVFLDFNVSHSDAPASATVFCNGKNIKPSTQASLQTAFTIGFELGNHTQHHYNLVCLSPAEIQAEIQQTDAALKRFDGKTTHLLRTPYGNLNDAIREAASTPIISWFIDTLDWTGRSADEIYQAVWESKFSGCIVLMHDGYPNTVDALARLLPDLYEDGYQAVTVSQMAKAHNCPLKIGSVYIRARKK